MQEYIVQGIVSNVGGAKTAEGGARYDHVEITQQGGGACRLRDVFVPARLLGQIALHAIGEFHCLTAEVGSATEILDFIRADGATC